MEPWLWIDGPVVAWVDDPEQLTADAIEAMAGWSFWWEGAENRVMLAGEGESLID